MKLANFFSSLATSAALITTSLSAQAAAGSITLDAGNTVAINQDMTPIGNGVTVIGDGTNTIEIAGGILSINSEGTIDVSENGTITLIDGNLDGAGVTITDTSDFHDIVLVNTVSGKDLSVQVISTDGTPVGNISGAITIDASYNGGSVITPLDTIRVSKTNTLTGNVGGTLVNGNTTTLTIDNLNSHGAVSVTGGSGAIDVTGTTLTVDVEGDFDFQDGQTINIINNSGADPDLIMTDDSFLYTFNHTSEGNDFVVHVTINQQALEALMKTIQLRSEQIGNSILIYPHQNFIAEGAQFSDYLGLSLAFEYSYDLQSWTQTGEVIEITPEVLALMNEDYAAENPEIVPASRYSTGQTFSNSLLNKDGSTFWRFRPEL